MYPNYHKPTGKSNRKTFGTREEITTGEGSQRNRPCHCGSNLKYKRCHMMLDKGLVPIKNANGGTTWEKGARIQQVAHNLGNLIKGGASL